ncbi:MAG: flagellar hook-associated protein FlgL [Rhodoferax sp.]|jgi:flagellar hook-associated protein 3 FlgL|nr:flagellar hook-associated protein FlgL [Rhodoferax sp.]
MNSPFTRLGTANAYDSSLYNLAARQSSLANLHDKLTSGKRITSASDDPTSAAIAERSLTRISRLAADQRALDSQTNAIALAETTLGEITETLQSFRELVVSAGNGGHSAAERQAIAFELTGLRDQIISSSNLKDTNGLPLFGALGSALRPFTGPQATAPDYTFAGLPGQAASQAVAIPTALDGDSAFMLHPVRDQSFNVTVSTVGASNTLRSGAVSVSNASLASTDSYQIQITGLDTTTTPGNTIVQYSVTNTTLGTPAVTYTAAPYVTGQTASIAVTGMAGLALTLTGSPAVGNKVNVSPNASIFSVMDNAIKDLTSATTSNAVGQAVGQALSNLDIGMQRVSIVRGKAGDLLGRAERITANQQKRGVQLESDRSTAEDMDMVKGISDFNNLQTGYQAALQTYAQVQKLSLFNFIG